MYKKVAILSLLFLLPLLVFTEKIAPLTEINKPTLMAITMDHLFISEKTRIYIYSLKNKKLEREFGKEGEGPTEFKVSHGDIGIKINVLQDHLLVNSAAKLSFYSHEGDFIRELKVPPMIYLIPAGDKFVANGLFESNGSFPNFAVFLWDGDLKNKKLLFQSDVPIGMGAKFIVPAYNFKYLVYKDKIYLATGKEHIEIQIFDFHGNHLFKINKDGKAIHLSDALKAEIENFYKTDPGYKDFWLYYKSVLTFPKYLPGLKDFVVENDKIYVQTYKEKGFQYEWIIYDLDGKEISSIFLPIGKTSPVAASPCTIYQNKYYYLKENLDEETWELYSVDL